MKKISVSAAPALTDLHPDLTGAAVRMLINADTVGSHRGMLSIAEFQPGGQHKLHRHPNADQISYLLSGEGEHLTANGPVPVKAGDTTHASRNEWHGFRNTGSGNAVLVSVYSPAATSGDTGYESYAGEIDRSREPQVAKTSLSKLQGDAALDADAGFIGLGVFWLATKDTIGSKGFLLGASTFEPGGLHEHHRHPNGDEFLFILEGGGEHLTPDGAVPLVAGEIAYIPAGEYHGYKNKEGVLTKTLFGYFGPGNLEEAGYEVRDEGAR
ncbi:cupin domain-containing protein [Bradyrhizobium sp. WSM3983]|uniref:cupin domain-containing protein n=1 Tax=Bradyrhizobium sp. WSM3983 TaxID=1038867 RepID=UPI000684491A|nr:cupin domain-containing protein [Bradyrhizobium sp. WSM3983]